MSGAKTRHGARDHKRRQAEYGVARYHQLGEPIRMPPGGDHEMALPVSR